MNKRQRTRWLLNLALLIIIIGLAAILILDKEEPVSQPRLSDYLPQHPVQLGIERPAKDRIRFSKATGQWQMLTPYQHAADNNVVERLLSIQNLEIAASFAAQDKVLAEFGLSPSIATVYIDNIAIHFGDTQPVNKKRYILLNHQIMLVDDQHMSQLNTGSVSYLDRHLIPAGKKITSLSIGDSPVALDADQREQWQRLKANWLSLANPPQNPADKQAPAEHTTPLIVTLDDGTQLNYSAIKRDIDFVLTRHPFEYHLAHTAIQTLGLDMLDSNPAIAQDASGTLAE